MTGARNVNFFWAPPPGVLGRGQKVKYYSISITKSISKIFTPNFVCVLTNERYKTYQTGFIFCHLDHALRVGLGGTKGPKSNSILLSVRYAISSYTIGRNSTKFGVRVTHMNGMRNLKKFFAPPPGEGPKGQIFNFNYKANFKDFYSKLCVSSHR